MGKKAGEDTTLARLKDLLIRPEKEQIRRIEHRLDNPMIRAEEISRSLPEAVSLSLLNGSRISRALQPAIDDSIKISVKKDPKSIADALAPALGPGIRKAVISTIMGMLQSLNQVLNHSFSIQGFKWRIEALRTRKQFAEVVMLHTLIFQVEQIFLIHRHTGIVLEHVVADGVLIQDPDLVSGMLTAIQDFVNDSFQSNTLDDLETLRMGSDRSIWIENGEHALIAVVIRGTPPLDLRTGYQEMLEEIHIKAGSALENFDGDPLPFAIFRQDLKEGLQFQKKDETKKTSPLLWIMLVIILSVTCLWIFNIYTTRQALNNYLYRLENKKGLIVISTLKKNGVYHIHGLKDPMADDPENLLKNEEKEHLKITGHWKAFYTLDPEFILTRAEKLLRPPPGIKLQLSGNTIHARGYATQTWIEMFQAMACTIPGIDKYNDDMVKNSDKIKLETLLEKLKAIKIYFDKGSSNFSRGQEQILESTFKTIQTIQTLQYRLKSPVQIIILGHTDSSGSEKLNLKLSRNRAEAIYNHLIVKGINPAFLTISGISTKIPLADEKSGDDQKYNRAISFKIFHNPSTQGSL